MIYLVDGLRRLAELLRQSIGGTSVDKYDVIVALSEAAVVLDEAAEDPSMMQRAHLAAEVYFGPVHGETGEWCLIPGASPKDVALAVLRAVREMPL